jgi:hypothetical protein
MPVDDGRAPRRRVYEGVDTTERRDRLIEQALDVEVVRDIGAYGDRCAAGGEDLLDRRFRSPLIVEVHDDDRVTEVSEPANGLSTEPM